MAPASARATQNYLHTLPGADAAALAAMDAIRGICGPASDVSEEGAGPPAAGREQDDELAQMRQLLAEMKALLEGKVDTA